MSDLDKELLNRFKKITEIISKNHLSKASLIRLIEGMEELSSEWEGGLVRKSDLLTAITKMEVK